MKEEKQEAMLDRAIQATERLRQHAAQDAYSKLRNEREKATFTMMMKMNPEALTNIRKEFFAREDSITLDEFIYIIQKHLVNKGENKFVMETLEQREFGSNMYELFQDIDVNGDGQLEWQEFTSFTVEKANLLNKRAKLTSIAHYHDSSLMLDPTARYRHRHDISHFVNIPTLGQFAMIEDHKNAIFVFNSRHGKLVSTINTDSAPIAIEHIAEKDKVSVVTSGADMTLSTYSLDDPNPKRRYKVQSSWATPGVQMTLAYSPESRFLFSGATNGNIYSWNVQERSLLTTLTGHTDIVMNLIVLKKLDNIASASLDKTLGVWDSHTNEQILRLHGHKKGVFDLCYNPNYRLIVSCGFEHDACVWSPFVNNLVYRLKGHHASLVGCQTVENTPEIITADTSGVFKLWDVRNFQCIQTFSANLSGQALKDSSKMNCFFHAKLPPQNSLQKEDDSRIYAASKMLFSFDQARVVHEATSDYYNVHWVAWNYSQCLIITASDMNVIVWDALVGSKKFTHNNICGEEISACCLDDRQRKMVIGDVTGNIGVYNASNAALMKTVHYSNPSVVVSVEYYCDAKRFIAGYANGVMGIFDEGVMEDCHLIRVFEHYYQHPELQSLTFFPPDRTVATAGGSSGIARLWDYDSGKCDFELKVCAEHCGHIIFMGMLDPFPIIVTSDSEGTIALWGSRGIKWQGKRITAFVNATPATADNEPRMRVPDDEEEPPRRALTHSSPLRKRLFHHFRHNYTPSVGGDDNASRAGDSSVGHGSTYTSALRMGGGSVGEYEEEEYDETEETTRELFAESEKKWGKIVAAQAISWDKEGCRLFTADDLGHLRCFSIRDVVEDISMDTLFTETLPSVKGICAEKIRNGNSALASLPHGVPDDEWRFLVGKTDNPHSYLGVEFLWSITAHEDRLISCTATPHGVLTSAADRLVKLWSFEGRPLGVLLQSVPVGARSRTWEVELNVQEMRDREEHDLDQIIEEVKELSNSDNKPDIKTMNFAGMKLGAEAAAFSRSELRQRIEKTRDKLGIDFPTNYQNVLEGDLSSAESTAVDDSRSYSPSNAAELVSVPSVNNKSLDDALKELKSSQSAVDYVAKTKQMTMIQQKRKAYKLEMISKSYEAKSGFNLKASHQAGLEKVDSQHMVAIEFAGSHHAREATPSPPHSAAGTPAVHAESAFSPGIPKSDRAVEAEVVPAGVSIDTGDEGGNEMEARDAARNPTEAAQNLSVQTSLSPGAPQSNSLSQKKSGVLKSGSKRTPAFLKDVKGKLADSIKMAQENGPRTQSIRESCKKYRTFMALETSISVNAPKVDPSDEEVSAMQNKRQTKFLSGYSQASANAAAVAAGGIRGSLSAVAGSATSGGIRMSASLGTAQFKASTGKSTAEAFTSVSGAASDMEKVGQVDGRGISRPGSLEESLGVHSSSADGDANAVEGADVGVGVGVGATIQVGEIAGEPAIPSRMPSSATLLSERNAAVISPVGSPATNVPSRKSTAVPTAASDSAASSC